jgi:uncharacterized protein (TIGR03032 family)
LKDVEAVWARHHAEWRDTAQVASHWEDARRVDPALLRFRVRGAFWEILDRLRTTLLVTREYEHLVVGLSVRAERPLVTFFPIPHPSGLVYDPGRGAVHLASTRSPNQLLELRPVARLKPRRDVRLEAIEGRGERPLVPVVSRFYPGCTYLHDLALVGGRLHANAVGENAVVRMEDDGTLSRVWWPRAIETRRGPVFDRNHIQLNSIAAGENLERSFFTASADTMTSRMPGQRNFPVDGRGVVFSGETREPIARGLTRPHSARLYRGSLYAANSGYGDLVRVEEGRFETVSRLPGWTRGLAFAGGFAFAGTSRVIPRFSRYAPGLDLEKSRCAIHAVEIQSGRVAGSLLWPGGNQIFAIDVAPRGEVSGFPFSARRRSDSSAAKRLFYAFQADGTRNS